MPRNSKNSQLTKQPGVHVQTPITSNKTTSIVEHKVQQPGFFSNIVQGFAWGTGTSIARNIFEDKTVTNKNIFEHKIVTNSKPTEENTCNQYKLCQKMDYPEECYNKMDQLEYQRCSAK